MPIPKTLTVTLTTHGDPEQPCVAACAELGLATDGPTVPEALHALARAIAIYEEAAPAAKPAAAAPETPPPENAPDATATAPRLRRVTARGRRPRGPTRNGTPPPALRSA